MNENERARLSAFVDGEVSGHQVDDLISQLSSDDRLREKFSQYLAVGEVMRGAHRRTELATYRVGLSPRVMAELDGAPLSRTNIDLAIISDADAPASTRPLTVEPRVRVPTAGATQRSLGRSSGFAIAASIVMAGVVGFFLAKQLPDPSSGTGISPETVPAIAEGPAKSAMGANFAGKSAGSATTISAPGETTTPTRTSASGGRRVGSRGPGGPGGLASWAGGWEEQDASVQGRLRGYLVSHSEYSGRGMRGMHPYARVVAYARTQQ